VQPVALVHRLLVVLLELQSSKLLSVVLRTPDWETIMHSALVHTACRRPAFCVLSVETSFRRSGLCLAHNECLQAPCTLLGAGQVHQGAYRQPHRLDIAPRSFPRSSIDVPRLDVGDVLHGQVVVARVR
jgi:hypothetical protein